VKDKYGRQSSKSLIPSSHLNGINFEIEGFLKLLIARTISRNELLQLVLLDFGWATISNGKGVYEELKNSFIANFPIYSCTHLRDSWF
jgi:hypothetical protein